ncbi:SDR family oxidoreductase [Oleomonas cavernae]|uniref:SDR family oxidoreductase n=1 Tax=Oleomonas cavernae TaxID=2320859 RepID=A0A418WHP7_9PROT|nr:SDR family oxidoreductase [Oleomonas cavernae]RJF89419.1 SDR family oxidoreductase [Oleomonas cavernae]
MTAGPFRADALAAKRILVTGGGSGLGAEIARGFAQHGATVYICGRRQGLLSETAARLSQETGGRVVALACDLRNPQSIDEMFAAIWAEGPLTGLVNNAAANFVAPTKSLSPRGYEAVRSTVMDGSFYVTLAAGKRWIADGVTGSVVSNLVTWVWTGSPFVVPAAMAKTAIHAMTMSLAVEWGPYGIRLNAVAPGPFPTEGAWEKLNPIPETSAGATQADQVPMRRFGKMHELQNLMIFLMSDGCEYLTGQTIAIDGAHHLAAPSTFAGLSDLTDEQWAAARERIKAASDRDKQQRTVG